MVFAYPYGGQQKNNTMDTATDIQLIKVDTNRRPLESGRTYSLRSMLPDIKSGKAEVRFKYGISEEDKDGGTKWIQENGIWVIYTRKAYSRKYGMYNERVCYFGHTKRNYKEVNDLFGCRIIDTMNTYL